MQTPTMIQYTTAPKSNRGNRLGRGSDSTSTMEQYGYSTPGTNITVSPTFSNIGNPNVSVGNIGGGQSTPSPTIPSPTIPSPTTPSPTTPSPRTPRPRTPRPTIPRPTIPRPTTPSPTTPSPTTPSPTTPSPAGGGETRGDTLSRALQAAVAQGQARDPRVTRSELKNIVKGTEGANPLALRDQIVSGKVPVGSRTRDFLNKQLKKAGEAKLKKNLTVATPPPAKKSGFVAGVKGALTQGLDTGRVTGSPAAIASLPKTFGFFNPAIQAALKTTPKAVAKQQAKAVKAEAKQKAKAAKVAAKRK